MRRTGLAVLFSLTSFVGAGLLFLVQPMITKRLLPLFGGAPAVWNTANLFFQVCLLVGYLTTHLLVRRLGVQRHGPVQLVLAALPLLTLPIGLAARTDPGTGSPVLTLIGLLLLAVGAPFVMLSTAGPLLQRWFAATTHPRAHDPYFLFAAGNAGSLLALLSYPALVEPRIGLAAQQRMWSWGYLVWFALLAVCALAVRRNASGTGGPARGRAPRPGVGRELAWVACAALASSLMLGTTTFITTDLAPVPLLWVVPLALYLLTFIVAFGMAQPTARLWAPRLARSVPVLLLPVVIVHGLGLWSRVGLSLGLFTLVALAAHTRVSADRPEVEGMTRFYLLVSVGGALGGLLNGVLGPLLLDRFYEYPLALGAALLLVPRPVLRGWFTRRYGGLGTALVVSSVLIAPVAGRLVDEHRRLPATLLAVAAGVLGVALVQRPRALATGVLVALLVPLVLRPALTTQRSFFGVQDVRSSGGAHLLMHGTTLHGLQLMAADQRRIPRSYYSRRGPIGQLLLARPHASYVGVVGLGSGTLAAYGHAGERMRFFEIDPDSVAIAQSPRLFTYLADSAARVDVVLGDGRLSLAKEQPGSFDVLVLDAFSSDAVPLHLLTREALHLYLSRLRPGGIVAFHISNRYLDLRPVLADVAAAEDATGLWQSSTLRGHGALPSIWVVIARAPTALADLAADARWHPLAPLRDSRHPWTDEWSDVLHALR